MRLHTTSGGWCAVLALAAAMSVAQAAHGLCDPTLPSPPNDAQGYRARGDRCEGRYLRNVTSTTLWPVSFTEVFEPFDASKDKILQVTWPAGPGMKEVALRAESVKRRVYYRMDTRRPAGDRTFSWPTDVLWALALASRDVGVLAWTTEPVADVPRVVYLPLRVTRAAAAATASTGYVLALMPGIQLEELSTALLHVGDDGLETVVRPLSPLQLGYYPALRAVSLKLAKDDLPARGVYRIELVARLAGGGVSRSDLWLYHAAP
jgi:hypothetical protein